MRAVRHWRRIRPGRRAPTRCSTAPIVTCCARRRRKPGKINEGRPNGRPSHRLLARRRYDDTGILVMMVVVMMLHNDDVMMMVVVMADLHRDLGDLFAGHRLLG